MPTLPLLVPRAEPGVGARFARLVPTASDSRPEAVQHLARIATIPHVVEHASRLAPCARLPQIAFVGGLAFGGAAIDARVARRFLEHAYRAATKTAQRIADDLALARTWEEWEGRCLLRACAVLGGRLRVVLAAGDPIDDWMGATS